MIEVEYLVEKETEIPEASRKILAFAAGFGLKLGCVRGKAIEFIQRKNPEHLQKLIGAGVVS